MNLLKREGLATLPTNKGISREVHAESYTDRETDEDDG